MERIILIKSGDCPQPNQMNVELKEDKIKLFYHKIIESYKPEIQKFYWGDEIDFIDAVKHAEKLGTREDTVKISCKNGQNVEFSRVLFDFLFKNDVTCFFEHPIGRRYEYENYIFIELIESPIVTIKEKGDKNGIFPITKDKDGIIESCLFIKSEKYGENYPSEIVPFFVSQMRNRLKAVESTLPSYFIDHFEPIKYILKIKKGQEKLVLKLLYKLSVNLGIIENSFLENQEISIQQEMQSIIDDENNIILTNESGEHLDSLKFYISAVRNPNPYYRFLDAYHIFESLFYKCFYDYVKKLDANLSKDELYDEIKKHTKEKEMLKLVLVNCLDDQNYIERIKDELVNAKTQELAKKIKEEYNIDEWPVTDSEKFASKLSNLIYAFRNAIVHSTESERYIEKTESPDLTPRFNDLTNNVLNIAKYVLEKNVEKW